MSNEKNETLMDPKTQYENETGSSFIDSLTGLFNHGFFQISLDREIMRSNRYGTSFSLAFIDIDSFSDLNRRKTHLHGDRTIKTLANLTLENIRESDIAARYTNDMLSVMMINSGKEQAVPTLERIRQKFEEKSKGNVTASIGLASYPEDAREKENLIIKAREALSTAKLRGKNKVKIFEENEETLLEDKPTILVVDDELRNVKLLDTLLQMQGYQVALAYNGKEALSIMRKADIDLVLLDIMMPEMDGYEVCRRLKQDSATRLIPIVLVTALDDEKSKVQGIEAGADDFISKPFSRIELLSRVKSLVDVKRLNNSLTSIENVLLYLANVVEAKDKYTQGHIERVANLAEALGNKMNLSRKELEALKLGGILHDIGKLGIPSDILNKPGPLTPEEWEIMKKHPSIGHTISKPLEKNLGQALDIIRGHHEKLDGTGYPDGKKGGELSMGTRIMGVVDIYDALITDRPYRKGMGRKKAFEILRKEADEGKLDKEIVECLIKMV